MNKIEAYNVLLKLIKSKNPGKRIRLEICLIWVSILFWTGKYRVALNYVNNALKHRPCEEVYCWRGMLYYFLEDYIKSAISFEKAESINPQSAEIKFFLAESYFIISEIEKAESKYRALINYKEMRSLGLYGTGCCLMKKDRFDEAISFFNKALENARGDFKVCILNKKGLCLLNEEDVEGALGCFQECLKLSNNYSIKLNLALTLTKLGNYTKAAELYKDYLSKNPHDLTAINNMSLCQAALGNYRQALEHCDKGLEIDPINVDLLGNKGYCHYKLNEYIKALDCLNQAEKYAKDDIIVLNNKALCLMAMEYYDEALRIFDKVLIKQKNDDVLINKAHCLIKKQKYMDALRCVEEITKKTERVFEVNTLKGICFERLGDNEKAVEYYNKSFNT